MESYTKPVSGLLTITTTVDAVKVNEAAVVITELIEEPILHN